MKKKKETIKIPLKTIKDQIRKFENRVELENKKSVFFYFDTPQRHAELLTNLYQDGLKLPAFFRAMITFYNAKDPRMMELISEIKTISQIKQARIDSMMRKGELLKERFGLEKEEIQNIFDILEEEMPDL